MYLFLDFLLVQHQFDVLHGLQCTFKHLNLVHHILLNIQNFLFVPLQCMEDNNVLMNLIMFGKSFLVDIPTTANRTTTTIATTPITTTPITTTPITTTPIMTTTIPIMTTTIPTTSTMTTTMIYNSSLSTLHLIESMNNISSIISNATNETNRILFVNSTREKIIKSENIK